MGQISLRRSIELAIATERLGSQHYEHLAAKFSQNDDIKEIFERLSKDEKIHEAQFKILLNQAPDEVRDADESSLEYLHATSVSNYLMNEWLEDAGSINSISDAIVKAITFEKATLIFYQAIQSILGDSPVLNEIMKIEKNHIIALSKVLITDAKFRGIEDRW